tara:strand:- start:135 stop:614 length:480 start_codon:yes stop_codon:yes gene_type:complete
MELNLFKKEEKSKDPSKKQPINRSYSHNKKQDPGLEQLNMVRHELTDVVRILRTLENRYNNLMKKVQLTDQNMIQEHKRLNKELKIVDSDLIDAKKELNELDYKFGLIIKELSLCAKKQDVDLIRRYMELWQPMNFIRKQDAEKMVDQMLKDRVKKKPQ